MSPKLPIEMEVNGSSFLDSFTEHLGLEKQKIERDPSLLVKKFNSCYENPRNNCSYPCLPTRDHSKTLIMNNIYTTDMFDEKLHVKIEYPAQLKRKRIIYDSVISNGIDHCFEVESRKFKEKMQNFKEGKETNPYAFSCIVIPDVKRSWHHCAYQFLDEDSSIDKSFLKKFFNVVDEIRIVDIRDFDEIIRRNVNIEDYVLGCYSSRSFSKILKEKLKKLNYSFS